jgi:hypothetical protein
MDLQGVSAIVTGGASGLGAADEFATLAVEVLGNSYLNGEVIRVDGGARLQPK